MRKIAFLFAFLGGCAAGPDYVRPQIEAPAQFKEMQGWRQAEPRDALPRGSWWTMFGDRELDALMARVDLSNQTLRAAEARFRQSRALADQARAALFPALSANASATRSKSPSLSNQPSFALGAVNNYNVALNTSWELDVWVERGQLEHAIALLVGEAPAAFSIERAPFAAGMPTIPVGLPSELLERRPDIAAAERSAAAANARIGVAQAAFFPTVTLSGAAGFRSTSAADLLTTPSRFWSLGGALAQAVFDGRLREAQKQQAIAGDDEDAATYRQSVLTAFQEVEDNLAALRILEEESRLQD